MTRVLGVLLGVLALVLFLLAGLVAMGEQVEQQLTNGERDPVTFQRTPR